MKYLTDVLDLFSNWMRNGLFSIAMAIVATLLTIYGGHFNKAVRDLTKKYPFMVRLMIFVCLCAFGYGLLTLLAAKLLCNMLGGLNNHALAPVVILIFIVIGFIAERKKNI